MEYLSSDRFLQVGIFESEPRALIYSQTVETDDLIQYFAA
ncbi:Hypothetical Protein XCAW_01266 [Xanthomonas citri subsp. citri Aw12879]|nr:Hypothetical Protein XCAW_01266 [Xanthomonas citri subsp. citri Aw12879]